MLLETRYSILKFHVCLSLFTVVKNNLFFVISYCDGSGFIFSQRERAKFYAQYIEKKMEIAKAIGVIPTVVT